MKKNVRARLGSLASNIKHKSAEPVRPAVLSDVQKVEPTEVPQHLACRDRLACDVLLRTEICTRKMCVRVLDMCSVIRFFQSLDKL